jgi:hypothetical protein
VNNQIVIGTLMNICDDPNRVSIGANWRESDTIKRVPIIVTGNDFSTLYAPLIRDGRMEKFYWQPEREDVVNIVWQVGSRALREHCKLAILVACVGIGVCFTGNRNQELWPAVLCSPSVPSWLLAMLKSRALLTHAPALLLPLLLQMYKEDGLARRDIETLIDTFGNQALDFFGALRAATYDAQIRDWMQGVAGEGGLWGKGNGLTHMQADRHAGMHQLVVGGTGSLAAGRCSCCASFAHQLF